MRKKLKAATRRLLAIADLKLGRLSSFQTIRRELETTRRELETTRKLLTPTTLNYSNLDARNSTATTPPITQIFISKSDAPPGQLLQSCAQSVKRCFPGSSHKIYGNQDIENFIKEYYDAELLDCYKRLKPYAYKADLARLCILYIQGGWYIDIGVTWTTPIQIPENIQLFAVRDRNHYCRSSWAVNNCIIFARKHHAAIRRGIEIIRDNVQCSYYGATSLCPTGPNVWGKAIAESSEPTETIFADVCELTPRHPFKNLAYVTEDGKIFAFAKPSIGGDGLAVFGETESNNYNTFYNQQDIYNAQI